MPSRRALDGVFDRDGIKTCLQAGLWNFAIRSVQFDYDPSLEPAFGYTRAFQKPDDFVRLASLSSSEYFRPPLMDYQDGGGFWFANVDTIYVRYVSSDAAYGLDFSLWPPNFTRFVEHFFGHAICKRETGSTRDKESVEVDMSRWLKLAKGTDAAEEPVAQLPSGSWASARGSRRTRFRGPDGRLIG